MVAEIRFSPQQRQVVAFLSGRAESLAVHAVQWLRSQASQRPVVYLQDGWHRQLLPTQERIRRRLLAEGLTNADSD